MRLGYLVPEFPGQTHIFFWREIDEIERLGHEVRLISTRLPNAKLVSHSWSREAMRRTTYLVPEQAIEKMRLALRGLLAAPRLSVRRSDLHHLSDAKDLFLCAALAVRLADLVRTEGLDHIHVHSCGRAALIGALAKQFSDIGLSLTLHGFLKTYGPMQSLKWRHADFATIITAQIAEQVRAELGQDMPEDVRIQPMGVRTDRFRRLAPYEPWRRGRPLRLFSCGRLNRIKGHDDLAEAIRRLVSQGFDARLIIAGEDDVGGRGYRRELEALIAEKGLVERVTLLGAVPEERIIQELQDCHVFALASLNEPLGVAYMEAMSCETPVVGTDAGGVPELIEDGRDGLLVPPRNPAALAEAVARIACDPQLALRLGQCGRRRVEKAFGAAQGAATLIDAAGEARARRGYRQVNSRP